MSCGMSPRCAMSRIRVIGTAQVNSSEKDGRHGKMRLAMKSSASPWHWKLQQNSPFSPPSHGNLPLRACMGDVPQSFGHRLCSVCSCAGPVMATIFLAGNLPAGNEGEIRLRRDAWRKQATIMKCQSDERSAIGTSTGYIHAKVCSLNQFSYLPEEWRARTRSSIGPPPTKHGEAPTCMGDDASSHRQMDTFASKKEWGTAHQKTKKRPVLHGMISGGLSRHGGKSKARNFKR